MTILGVNGINESLCGFSHKNNDNLDELRNNSVWHASEIFYIIETVFTVYPLYQRDNIIVAASDSQLISTHVSVV